MAWMGRALFVLLVLVACGGAGEGCGVFQSTSTVAPATPTAAPTATSTPPPAFEPTPTYPLPFDPRFMGFGTPGPTATPSKPKPTSPFDPHYGARLIGDIYQLTWLEWFEYNKDAIIASFADTILDVDLGYGVLTDEAAEELRPVITRKLDGMVDGFWGARREHEWIVYLDNWRTTFMVIPNQIEGEWPPHSLDVTVTAYKMYVLLMHPRGMTWYEEVHPDITRVEVEVREVPGPFEKD